MQSLQASHLTRSNHGIGHSLTFSTTFSMIVLCLLVVINKEAVQASSIIRRLCGKSLIQEVNRICTPEGYKDQCFHQSAKNRRKRNIDEDQWARELLQGSLSVTEEELRAARHQAHAHKKRGSRISNTCCQDGCDDEYLETFCCDDNELIEFQKLHSPA